MQPISFLGISPAFFAEVMAIYYRGRYNSLRRGRGNAKACCHNFKQWQHYRSIAAAFNSSVTN